MGSSRPKRRSPAKTSGFAYEYYPPIESFPSVSTVIFVDSLCTEASDCRRTNTKGRRRKNCERKTIRECRDTLGLPSGGRHSRFGSRFVRDDDDDDDGRATTLSSAYPSLSLVSAKRCFCSGAAETMTISLRYAAEFRDRSPAPRD